MIIGTITVAIILPNLTLDPVNFAKAQGAKYNRRNYFKWMSTLVIVRTV